MQPKFKIGELVKFINDPDCESGNIISYIFSSDTEEFVYKISAKEVDVTTKTIIDGFKNAKEDELVSMEHV